MDRWSRPAAGREPAAAALLSWLADPAAPRLCLVTGGAGCGKSTLLAWLVGHGTRPDTRSVRRVHGFAPLAGQSALTATWTLARQLSMAARTPGELVAALAADRRRTVLVLPDLHAAEDPETVSELALALADVDHVRLVVETRPDAGARLRATGAAVMNLDEDQWTNPGRYAEWAAQRTPGQSVSESEVPLPVVDLDDPAAVCAADPWHVTRLFERSGETHGGLREAWLRAGLSLTDARDPAARALTLLTALGDGADPRHPDTLAALAGGSGWRVAWRRVRHDVRPPWPGPARALSVRDGQLLVADHQGTVRVLAEAGATPVGRLPRSADRLQALAAGPEGEVLGLDAEGTVRLRVGAVRERGGLEALLDDGPAPLEGLLERVNARLREHPGTALAASGRVLATGDASGEVHAFLEGDAVRDAVLHEGPVTALAALDLPVPPEAEGRAIPLLYSGGLDGRVRAWGPRAEPLGTPLAARPCPVTALAAGVTPDGPVLAVAWSDGLVEHHTLDSDGPPRVFHPGLAVRALAVTGSGLLVVGTDESLIALRPR
ncbi:WD40 repeat domain-containing protein [Streptomyces sp. NPDC059597]|uniref:WD40 repeat domain-containing protein n=1 Tax=Streptomyces sp. NPDC059597 TaxID=3346879 RepID=UPI00369986D8